MASKLPSHCISRLGTLLSHCIMPDSDGITTLMGIHIRQQNLNKSKIATFELFNTLELSKWIVCIQESWLDHWHNT